MVRSVRDLNGGLGQTEVIDLLIGPDGAFLTHYIGTFIVAVTAVIAVARRTYFLVVKHLLAVATAPFLVLSIAILGKRMVHVPIATLSIHSSDACRTLRNMVVVLHEIMHVDDALLVSPDFLVDVVSLDLSEDLDHSLLEPRPCHQRSIVWGRKSLLPNFDLLNRFHAISNLIVHFVHKVADSVARSAGGLSRRRIGLEDENVALLPKIDLV